MQTQFVVAAILLMLATLARSFRAGRPLVRASRGRLFAAGVVAGGEPDSVVSRCTRKISEALKPVHLKVSAAHDDPNGSHIAIECVSSMFEGKPLVVRQRLIYKAIWDEMSDGGAVHAVDQIVAKTPQEAQSIK